MVKDKGWAMRDIYLLTQEYGWYCEGTGGVSVGRNGAWGAKRMKTGVSEDTYRECIGVTPTP